MRVMVYEGPKKITIESVEPAEVKSGELRVKSLYSGISHGTEMNIYRGKAPFFARTRDSETGLFRDGGQTEVWKYPIRSCDPGVWYMGYANVGTIVEKGSDVTGFEIGDTVYVNAPHQSEVVCHVSGALKVPDRLRPEHAVIFTNLMTAFNSILDSRIKLGDTVVVSGLGVMGQLIIQLAKLSGAGKTIGIDVFPRRLEAALENGADCVFNPLETNDIAAAVRKLTNNRGADLVMEVSGSQKALQEAIRIAGYDTTVTTVGWYPGECSALNLSEEFHHNRITLRSSHTGGTDPAIAHMWSFSRKIETCLELLTKLQLDNIITHKIPYENIAGAFELIDQNPGEAIQVVLQY